MAKKDYPQIYVEYEREDTEQTTSHEVLGGELWFDWLYHIHIVTPKGADVDISVSVRFSYSHIVIVQCPNHIYVFNRFNSSFWSYLITWIIIRNISDLCKCMSGGYPHPYIWLNIVKQYDNLSPSYFDYY